MAGIINGEWRDSHFIDADKQDKFCNWITADGSPGKTGRGGFNATPERYHLYLAQGCPCSHRVLITLFHLGFEKYFSITFVDDVKRNHGWQITENKDPVFAEKSLHAVMIMAEGKLTSKTTVPLLVDKWTKRIVSNHSADIVRMIDNLNAVQKHTNSLLWPVEYADAIDALNNWIVTSIDSSIYGTLFETDTIAKKTHIKKVRAAFSTLDYRLSGFRYLHGEQITASDVWLFATLLRFNSIYSELFGLDIKIEEFLNLACYLRDLWSIPAFVSTSDLTRIEQHYYQSLIHGPNGVVEPGKGKTLTPLLRFDLDPCSHCQAQPMAHKLYHGQR